MNLDLLRVDPHFVAVNKPASLAVHATDDPLRPDLIAVLTEQLTAQGIAFEGPLALRRIGWTWGRAGWCLCR